jgi:methyl-accepting chemotaxis protein
MQWFNNLKIGTKILSSFLIVCTIMAIVGFQGLSNMGAINGMLTDLYKFHLLGISDNKEANISLVCYDRAVRNYVLARTQADRDRYLAEMSANKDTIFIMLDRVKTSLVTDKGKEIHTKILASLQEYFTKADQVIKTANNAGLSKISPEVWNAIMEARHSGDVADNLLNDMSRSKEQLGQKAYDESDAVYTSSRLYMILFIIGGIGIGFGLGIFISKMISNPVKELAQKAEYIANGDLTVDIQQNSNDEIGQLSASFGKMVNGLRETIGGVAEASAAVASASTQISSSTEEMAAGAQEQTSQASEVASAVEEMTKTIIENSKNASNTSDTAKESKQAAEQGGKIVEDTIAGMTTIANVVKMSADTVKELGKSSDQIGEIIGVIDDIADQTNLLALNAAIEAARAGEQGRGFAVVADEVRKLAERTTKATKEIAGMIKKIQGETVGAVNAMEQGTQKVDEGMQLADKAGASLKDIVDISQRVTDMVNQIAAASEQQSSASEQISKNVEAISAVTNQTATGTQQIAHAAEDLNRLTENLTQLVGRFKLSDSQQGYAKKSVTSSRLDKTKSHLAVRSNGKLVPHEA